MRDPWRRGYELGLTEALGAGQRILRKGGSAVNAVTEAVAVLEDIEVFNAGKAAVLCADGSVELSAAVMRGRDLAVGAMAGLKRTKNPVGAARAIMDCAHGLLFGAEADGYAESKGLEIVPAEYFVTPQRKRQWEAGKTGVAHGDQEEAGATVGAVARDRRGHLAAATSTGGLVNQLPGRVGDTPVVGAGTWADDAVCAVSATGKGDAFARIAFARRVADLIEIGGLSALDAASAALQDVRGVKGIGGCILIDAAGNIVLPFNSPHMLRGWVIGDDPAKVAILPYETTKIEEP